MAVFSSMTEYGDHEEVIHFHHKESGLKAIVAIHNTALGPALGGCRMWNYANEEEALIDVLRLSKGMTYKAAVAGLNLGGGKSIIWGDPKKHKTEFLFRAFGTFINSLNGKYITAEDVGTSVNDMEYVFMETPFVTGIPKALGGSGDPSPYTAHGTLMGIKASAQFALGDSSLKGMRVAVQGLGNVGSHLVDYLIKEEALVLVADIDPERTKKIKLKYPQIEVVAPDTIALSDCDIFAPCALGSVINDQSLPKLKCKIVAGGANNQLAEVRHGKALKELGILYAPDYVINAGGLMNVFVELEGYSSDRAFEKTNQVFDNLLQVYQQAKADDIPTNLAADRVAEKRLRQIGSLRQHHHGRTARPFSTLKEMTSRQK